MDVLSKAYGELVALGIPNEDARFVLPNAATTNIVMTVNARELRHFFKFRCCERAQWEIRDVAREMLRLAKEIAPKIFKNAGPSCVCERTCPEGDLSCGRIKVNSNGT
jgi:thymidylate synthase (FAD)